MAHAGRYIDQPDLTNFIQLQSEEVQHSLTQRDQKLKVARLFPRVQMSSVTWDNLHQPKAVDQGDLMS